VPYNLERMVAIFFLKRRFSKSCGRAVNSLKMEPWQNFAIALGQVLSIMVAAEFLGGYAGVGANKSKLTLFSCRLRAKLFVMLENVAVLLSLSPGKSFG
jgi:hypothetical protein